MNKAGILNVRLNQQEVSMLEHLLSARSHMSSRKNASELVRLLIRREYSRRTVGKSVVETGEYSTDARLGRRRRG